MVSSHLFVHTLAVVISLGRTLYMYVVIIRRTFCNCSGFEKSRFKKNKQTNKQQHQCPVAAPFSWMTAGSTFWRWPMYFWHFATVTVAQKSWMPSSNSLFVLGFTSLRMYSFSSCHRHSIGFMSGLSAGVRHQFTALSSNHWRVRAAVCFGSLSWTNLWPSGYTARRKGRRDLSRIAM